MNVSNLRRSHAGIFGKPRMDSLVLHKTPMPGSLSTGVASQLDGGAPSRNHQRIWEVDRLSESSGEAGS